MTHTFSPFSASSSLLAPVPSGHGGGALTGPARPRPDRPDDPAELLRSAVRLATLRDLRRLGEALREPAAPARLVSLRHHVHFLLAGLDRSWAPASRLHQAVEHWRSDAGRDTVRQAVLEIESVLAPPDGEGPAARCGGTAADRMFVAAGRPRTGVVRWWWLLDAMDEPDATSMRSMLTGPQRLAVALGRRRAQRRLSLLWN